MRSDYVEINIIRICLARHSRHTCAIHTLEASGDIRRVALWLGHSNVQSTEIYLRVDPAEKLGILGAGTPPEIRKGKFKGVSDRLLAMLTSARAS